MQWLIDGHNLIGQMPNLRLDDPDDEAKLLEHLQGFRARTGHQVTVIFDAGPGYRPAKTKKNEGHHRSICRARPDGRSDH